MDVHITLDLLLLYAQRSIAPLRTFECMNGCKTVIHLSCNILHNFYNFIGALGNLVLHCQDLSTDLIYNAAVSRWVVCGVVLSTRAQYYSVGMQCSNAVIIQQEDNSKFHETNSSLCRQLLLPVENKFIFWFIFHW